MRMELEPLIAVARSSVVVHGIGEVVPEEGVLTVSDVGQAAIGEAVPEGGLVSTVGDIGHVAVEESVDTVCDESTETHPAAAIADLCICVGLPVVAAVGAVAGIAAGMHGGIVGAVLGICLPTIPTAGVAVAAVCLYEVADC
ncbi:MAG: hypothetical protein OXF02_07860 [Simkaniaceae bacterium]|nr:hypothetical protein [Simkaniaceae bacterium]